MAATTIRNTQNPSTADIIQFFFRNVSTSAIVLVAFGDPYVGTSVGCMIADRSAMDVAELFDVYMDTFKLDDNTVSKVLVDVVETAVFDDDVDAVSDTLVVLSANETIKRSKTIDIPTALRIFKQKF